MIDRGFVSAIAPNDDSRPFFTVTEDVLEAIRLDQRVLNAEHGRVSGEIVWLDSAE